MNVLKQSRAPSTSAAVIVNHPLRARCWYALAERTLSPKQLAEEFGAELSDVAYHVRVLRDHGVIELVAETPVRGAVGHSYKAVERPVLTREEVAAMETVEATANATRITQLAFADITRSLDSGKFADRPDHAAIRYPMDLDEEGWTRVGELYESLINDLYETQAASDERRSSDGAPSIRATALAFLFELPRRGER